MEIFWAIFGESVKKVTTPKCFLFVVAPKTLRVGWQKIWGGGVCGGVIKDVLRGRVEKFFRWSGKVFLAGVVAKIFRCSVAKNFRGRLAKKLGWVGKKFLGVG